MKKKFLCAVLTLCVAFAAVWTVVSADENSVPDTAWRDYAAENFAGGTGTADDPYLITNGAELAKIAVETGKLVKTGPTTAAYYEFDGVHFRLENDIDLSAHRWNPIGTYAPTIRNSYDFRGFLDGNGKKITGLVVDETDEKNSAGLFGCIGNSKTGAVAGVKDLTIENARIYSDETDAFQTDAGILAGFVMANSGYTCEFTNITVSGKIENNCSAGYAVSGGMFGEVYRIKAKDCNAENVEIGFGSNSGGFVGMDAGSTYENCTASGKITGLWGLGGFAGYTDSASTDGSEYSTFSHCIADVNVVGSDWRLGGFVGYSLYAHIQNCVAYGNVESTVTGWEPKVGGFAGEVEMGLVANCHTLSKITAAIDRETVTGFMNFSGGDVGDCSYNKEANPTLFATQERVADASMEGETKKNVLISICEDVLNGHVWSEEMIVDKEPTCTDEGYESQHCIRCDKEGERSIIEKAPHDWNSEYTVDKEATCVEVGEESIHCKNCDEKKETREIAAKGHKFEWVTDREPTETETGLKHEECTVCGLKKDGVEIPKKNKSVDSGDVTLTASAVILAVATLAAAVIAYRKKQSL